MIALLLVNLLSFTCLLYIYIYSCIFKTLIKHLFSAGKPIQHHVVPCHHAFMVGQFVYFRHKHGGLCKLINIQYWLAVLMKQNSQPTEHAQNCEVHECASLGGKVWLASFVPRVYCMTRYYKLLDIQCGSYSTTDN